MIFKTGKYHICIKKERMIYISENIDVSPFIKSFEEFKSIKVDPNGDIVKLMQYNGEFIFVKIGGYNKKYEPHLEATHLTSEPLISTKIVNEKTEDTSIFDVFDEEAEELYKKLTTQDGNEEKKVQKPKTIEEIVDDYWSCRIMDECYTNDYEADHMSADKILEELLASMKLYKTLTAYKKVDKEFA